jgi:hypothetical protein
MSNEEYDNIDTDKIMKIISMIEENSLKINNLLNKIKENNEKVENNKKLVQYLMEHTDFKDNELNILIPGNIFNKIERKIAVQYIQSQIEKFNKENVMNKEELINVKKLFVQNIENVSELHFIEPDIFNEIFPLLKLKFPKEFKQKDDDLSDDD